MAEILERGTPPSEYVYDVRCKRCETLARFKRTEFKFTGSKYNVSYYETTCPVCNHAITLDEHELTSAQHKRTPRPAPPRPEKRPTEGGFQSMISRQWDKGEQFTDK